MGDATWAVPNFLGGELSQFAQGRFDKPDYRVSLNICFNGFPTEIGTWVRRPGTRHAFTTRGGAPGRVIKFDFEQANATTLEFTDGWLRFRAGASLIATNDPQEVLSISSADPAVVEVAAATDWETGNTLLFSSPGPAPLLENRQFLATRIDDTHFSIADELSGTSIDGATLGTIAVGATVQRVFELTTVYSGGSWSRLRAVQAETTDILLNGTNPPQALTVTSLPTETQSPVFELNPAIFNDGPYLDPFTNGVQATPSAVSGIISLTLSFPIYETAKAYAAGAFITSGAGQCYVSLVDHNVGNSPGISPTFWGLTSVGAAINDGKGFLGTDVGRLVRLLSEPVNWDKGATYSSNDKVSYNPSGAPGAATYWQAQATNTGFPPGADLVNWKLIGNQAAIWTWGRIVSLTTIIDRALAGSNNIGNMTDGAGVNAAFNGVFAQPGIDSAKKTVPQQVGTFPPQTILMNVYVGKNYTGASPQQIQSATVYPTSDDAFFVGDYRDQATGYLAQFSTTLTFKLRGKMTAPTSASDGTFLGQTATGNRTSAVTIISSDQTTAWNYVWVEMVVEANITSTAVSYGMSAYVGQVSFFGPAGTGTNAGVNVEILGPKMLYTNPVATWRLGAFSETTGWPTCGTYYEGRLWLSGAIPNRFDASVSNGIDGGTVNFAPTNEAGVVAGNSAITEKLNSDSVNPIFWMEPDLQGIIVGTQAGEYLIQAPTNGPLAPTNIAARRVTKIGCANVEPRRTDHTTVFVQRYGQKLMEYFADVFSGKFSAPNVADKAQHIVRAGIAELAYQSATTPIIWGRDADGSLFGCTYKRDTLMTAQGPTFAAWHRHALGSGRVVESLCIGPSVSGDLDAITMVTNDPATGTRHVEVMTDCLDELAPLASAWLVDDGAAPSSIILSGAPVTGAPYGGMTLHGLWHLNGKTVSVFAGGLDCGDFAISDGSCFVPFGDGISGGTGSGLLTKTYAESFADGIPVAVGFTFTSQGQLVRPITQADTGARNGPALGKTRRQHRYAALLNNTKGLSVGTTFTRLLPANFKADNGQALGALDSFSGIYADTIDDNYSFDGMMCWQVTRPLPANMVALSGNLQTQDQ